MPALILHSDAPEFTIADANKAFSDLLLEEKRDLQGEKIKSLFEGPLDEQIKDILSQTLLKQEKQVLKIREEEFKGRSEGDYLLEATPFSNDKTNLLLTVFKPVSNEGTADLDNPEFRRIVEHSTIMFYTHDTENVLTYVSPQSREFLGCKPEEAKKRWTEFVTDHPVNKYGYKTVMKAIETGEAQPPYELELKKLNGEVIWVEVNEAPIKQDGKVTGIVGSLTDITKRNKIYKNLKQSEKQYRDLFDMSPQPMWVYDLQTGRFLDVNKAAVNHYGYTRQEFLGMTIREIRPPGDIAEIDRIIEMSRNKDSFYHKGNFRHIKKNGELIDVVIQSNIIEYDGAKAKIVLAEDITEKRRAEHVLQQSEQRFKSLVQDGSDLIAILDKEGTYKYISPTSVGILGIEPGDFVGKNALSYVHDDDQDRIKKILEDLAATKRIHIDPFRFKNSEGEWRWMETVVTNLMDEPSIRGYVANSRDVTHQIKREAQLNESLKRYDIVAKATSDTIWDLDLNQNLMTYNSNIYNMFGYSETEVSNVHKWWQSKIHTDDKQHVNRYIESVLKKGTDRFQMEYRFRCADGSYKHIYDRAFLIKDDSGKPVRMIGAMQDVTTDVEEEQRLKLLESVITHTTESVVISEAKPADFKGRKILYVNKAFTKMTGYSREEVIGKTLHFLNGPRTSKNERNRLREAINNFHSCEVEFINYKKSGEEFWINLSTVPVANKKGIYTHWISIGRDITLQKNKEEEIRSSLKEKETLLAEIHHRVKNNLAVVSSLMQMQAMANTNDEFGDQLMESVLRIKSMATIHEQLYQSKSFSKLPFAQSLQGLVENVVDTMKVNKSVDLAFDMMPIYLNINQCVPCSLIANEVLTNVLKHGFKNRKKGVIEVNLNQQENQVVLTISDDGIGLPDDFPPENTTMGIELINLLTEQLAGENRFASNPQGGTTFELRFTKADVKGIGSALVN